MKNKKEEKVDRRKERLWKKLNEEKGGPKSIDLIRIIRRIPYLRKRAMKKYCEKSPLRIRLVYIMKIGQEKNDDWLLKVAWEKLKSVNPLADHLVYVIKSIDDEKITNEAWEIMKKKYKKTQGKNSVLEEDLDEIANSKKVAKKIRKEARKVKEMSYSILTKLLNL